MHNVNKSNYYSISSDTDVLLAIIDFFGSQVHPCDSIQFELFYNRLNFMDRLIEVRWPKETLRTHIIDFIDNNRDIMMNTDEYDTG